MDSMHEKNDVDKTVTGNEKKGGVLIADAVDPFSLFEDIEESPAVVAATLVPNPPDEEL